MPLDKGLLPIKGDSPPWGVVSAFLCASFYVLSTRGVHTHKHGMVLGAALDDADASAYCAFFLVACRLHIMTKATGTWTSSSFLGAWRDHGEYKKKDD